MPLTPDAFPGVSQEEGIDWEEQSSDPSLEQRLQFVQDKGLRIFVDGVARAIGETRESIWQTEIDDAYVDTPPGSPSAGYRVIVGDSPTGVFVGHEGEIAQYTGSSWVFSVPREGSCLYVKAEDTFYVQIASSAPWVWGIVVTQDQHRSIRQLIHFIEEGPAGGFASGAYKEVLPTGNPFPTSIIWWNSSSKLQKIVERTVTWTGANPTTDEWKMYDSDGITVLVTVSDSISYSGPFESTRTRTITVS